MKTLFLVAVFLLAFCLHLTSTSDVIAGQKNETIQGKIDAISLEKSEVTIAAADRRVVVTVTPDTKIRVNQKDGKLADLRAGVTATVIYTTKEGRHNAKSINVEALFQ